MSSIAQAEPVHFEDANLKAGVKRTLKVTDSTAENMKTLTGFGIYDTPITSLVGLEHATNLWSIELYNNTEISDLSPLAGLTKISELKIPGNQNITASNFSFPLAQELWQKQASCSYLRINSDNTV